MRILEPFAVTDTTLKASTVPETDHAAWASGTAYTAGQKVIRTQTHRIYEALVSTTGDVPETSPTKWLDLGATNRWRMFDDKVGTVTTATGSFSVESEMSDMVTGVALLELVARTVTVTMTDPTDGVVYDRTVDLQSALSAADWFEYFFEPFNRRTVAVFFEFPFYRGARLKIDIESGATEQAACGVCLIGQMHTFAKAVAYGASAGIQDYSRKTTDDFGNVQITERAFAKIARWDVLAERSRVDKLFSVLSRLRARPALYIGGDMEDVTVVYGFPRNWDITISYPQFVDCAIDLEGLI